MQVRQVDLSRVAPPTRWWLRALQSGASIGRELEPASDLPSQNRRCRARRPARRRGRGRHRGTQGERQDRDGAPASGELGPARRRRERTSGGRSGPVTGARRPDPTADRRVAGRARAVEPRPAGPSTIGASPGQPPALSRWTARSLRVLRGVQRGWSEQDTTGSAPSSSGRWSWTRTWEGGSPHTSTMVPLMSS